MGTRSRLIGLIALCVAMVTVPAIAPAAAEGPPLPEFLDIHDVIPSMTTTAGLVRDIVRMGDRVYIAGTFTGLRESSSGPVIDQRYLAAIDAATGEIIESFDPDINGQVRTLGAAPNGSRLYIGGDFTSINGTSVSNAAALNPNSGNPLSWATVNFGPVVDIVVDGADDVYLGGYFGRVDGQDRQHVAKVDGPTGNVLAWEADLASGDPAKSLALSPDGTRVYVGGGYTYQQGPSNTWVFRGFLEAFDTTSGSDDGGFDANPGYEVLAIDTHGDHVFSAQGGPGGRGVVYRTSNGSQERSYFADGDVQEVRVIGNKAYYGGHFVEEFGGHDAVWVATVDVDDLSVDASTFTPSIRGGLGVWAFHYDGNHLYIGGDVNSASHHAAFGFARYSPVVFDDTPPPAPANLHVSTTSGSSITIDWDAITHTVPFTYIVRRDGIQRAELPGTTEFTDTGLSANTVYHYEVLAETIYGIQGKVADLTAATPPPTTSVIVATGDDWRYLDNGSNQGTAWRAIGFDHSSWASGPGELGYGDGDEATVVASGPNGNHYITTYFRRTFSVSGSDAIGGLEFELLVDDGAVVYLNGVEVVRQNMPSGTITSSTTASSAAPSETAYTTYQIDPAIVVKGSNVIAVEVHQASSNSSDISFDARMRASVIPKTTLVKAHSTWRYDDDGHRDSGWRKRTFADGSWPAGPAQLGFGDGDEATVTNDGIVTTYFRRTFQVSELDHLRIEKLRVRIRRDDGAVIYLNGKEVARTNMAVGKVKNGTKAATTVKGKKERRWYTILVPATRLRAGENVIAVEVHQDAKDSRDASFDLRLYGLA